MKAHVLPRGGRRRSHDGVLRIRDSPSPLARLHRLVFALESSLQAPIALRAFFIAFFLLLFAERVISTQSPGASLDRENSPVNAACSGGTRQKSASMATMQALRDLGEEEDRLCSPARERRLGILAGTGLWYRSILRRSADEE